MGFMLKREQSQHRDTNCSLLIGGYDMAWHGCSNSIQSRVYEAEQKAQKTR